MKLKHSKFLEGKLWQTLLLFSHSVMSDSLPPLDCSTPRFLVLHYLPELAQNHVHLVSDVIQPSLPLSFSSPPVFNLSQRQGLFQCVNCSYLVAKVWVFSNTTIQRYQVFGAQTFFYNKARHGIKKQRHYFAVKVPYSQSYGFSSSHVWTWELNHKEGWGSTKEFLLSNSGVGEDT